MSDSEKNQNNNEQINPPLMDYMNNPKNKNNLILIGIVAIAALLLTGFAVYNIYGYFQQANKTKDITNQPAQVQVLKEDNLEEPETPTIPDLKSLIPEYMNPKQEDYEGIIVSPNEIKNYNNNSLSIKELEEQPRAIKPQVVDGIIPNWTPNDYKFGDITGSNHTVVRGDTLWEISEGRYGTGSEWVKIENKNKTGYLNNGNPLIVPGQNLVLP